MPGLRITRRRRCMRRRERREGTETRRTARAPRAMLCAAALFGTGLLVAGAQPTAVAPTSSRPSGAAKLRGVLVTAQQASDQRLRQIKADGGNAVVLNLAERDTAAATQTTVRRIRAAGLAPYYWIEVGRCP